MKCRAMCVEAHAMTCKHAWGKPREEGGRKHWRTQQPHPAAKGHKHHAQGAPSKSRRTTPANTWATILSRSNKCLCVFCHEVWCTARLRASTHSDMWW